MKAVLAAAAIALAGPAAFAQATWQPVMPALGIGSATCFDPDEPAGIVCGALLCDRSALSFGFMGLEMGQAPSLRVGTIEVDGVPAERQMHSRLLAGVLLQVLTPITPVDPLYRRLASGNKVRITVGDPLKSYDFDLDGAATEFPRVADACLGR